jgi:hypothetical protein
LIGQRLQRCFGDDVLPRLQGATREPADEESNGLLLNFTAGKRDRDHGSDYSVTVGVAAAHGPPTFDYTQSANRHQGDSSTGYAVELAILDRGTRTRHGD